MVLRHTPLVPPDRVAGPYAYRQLSRGPADESFRTALEVLVDHEHFAQLCRTLSDEGALSLAGLLSTADFGAFRWTYDAEIGSRGSRGSLHSYMNVAASECLYGCGEFWDVVAHPLFVVLIAYALGGPVRLIDLRAKNTQPVDVVARDNTLHLDNTPFSDEYKVVVTWQSGTDAGPSGQGLAYLPRTNRLFRQCFVEPDRSVWSDEDACIFPTRERVDEAIAAQARFLGGTGPSVVHLTDLAAPCHTIMAASRLVHQRYRTAAGAPRSAVMASFHRTEDCTEPLGPVPPFGATPLTRSLIHGGSADQFLAHVRRELIPKIIPVLDRMTDDPSLVVDHHRHLLTGPALEEWYARQSAGVTLNKLRSQSVPCGSDTVERLTRRLLFDIQGPLNMPFYPDLSEAERRRARIWLRELPPEQMRAVVAAAETGSAEPTDAAEMGACLADLGVLLAKTVPTVQGAAAEAARSAPAFVRDLRITVSWLEGECDLDSLTTGAAFAFLAAALTTRWFELGEPGRRVRARLFGLYRTLVGESGADRT